MRQLAGDLALAPGAVTRAYTELEAEGLVETSRTGTWVRLGRGLSPELRTATGRFVRAAPSATPEDVLRAVNAEWGLL